MTHSEQNRRARTLGGSAGAAPHVSCGVPAGPRPSPVPTLGSPASIPSAPAGAGAPARRRARRRSRGFTLIEIAVTIAIIAVLAGLAFGRSRAAARNVRLVQAADDLAAQLAGLRSTALSEGKDHLLVVVDAPGNEKGKDPKPCADTVDTCAAAFVLAAPTADFKLAGFDPAHPDSLAEFVASEPLPRHARFYLETPYKAPPAPFGGVAVLDDRFVATCASGSQCFAIRFTASGTVEPVTPAGGTVAASGFAFVLASDAELEGAGGDHRGVLVGFPAGVVKSWAYAP